MSKFENQIVNRMIKNHTDSMNFAIPDKYAHIDFTPPKGAIEAAKRALEQRSKKPASQRGMTPIGIARARDLSNGKQLSPDTLRRMLAYFTRHEVDKQGSTWDEYGKGRQAWDGWGGDAGFTWSKKIVGQMDKADEVVKALGESIEDQNQVQQLIKGKPFLTLALGDVNSRMNGSEIGKITIDDLKEMIRLFYERKESDPVIIDWNHATSPFMSNQISSPETAMALGQITDLELKDEGLIAYPLYTKKGAKIVEESEGNLWSSPEFVLGPVYARNGGEKIGNAQLLAVTLTPRPAQAQNKIDRILLTEGVIMDQTELQSKSQEELIALLLDKDALVKQLEAKLEAMANEYEAAQAEDALEPNEPSDSPMAMGSGMDKAKAMSETTANLMNEMSTKIAMLNEQVGKLTAEKHQAERKIAIDSLLNTGRISPSEVQVCEQAFDLKKTTPAFWNHFSERKPNQAVNLKEVGHSTAAKTLSLTERVEQIKKEKQVTFAQALDLFIKENPNEYNSYFGG
jgi:phage I-like protein